nr:ABC transporter permease [Sulfodiicoccus acidiphilus]
MVARQSKAYLATSLFYGIMFPVAFIVSFETSIRSAQVLAGTLTMYIFLNTFIGSAQNTAFLRYSGGMSLIYVTKTPRWMVTLSYVTFQLAATVPMAVVLVLLGESLVPIHISWPPLICTFALGSAYSFLLGTAMGLTTSVRTANQLSQVLGWTFAFFAPTFVSIYSLPVPLRLLSLVEPTTAIAQELVSNLEGRTSLIYILLMLVYFLVSFIMYRIAEGKVS